MTEKTISIEGLDSVDVYGVNDRKLDRMRHYFPEVRIIARGTDIRLEGPDEQVELLSQRIQALTAILRRGGGVSDSDLERMLDWQTYPSELEEREPAHNEEYYNIVYGNEGRWSTSTTATTSSSPSARQAQVRRTRPSRWLSGR